MLRSHPFLYLIRPILSIYLKNTRHHHAQHDDSSLFTPHVDHEDASHLPDRYLTFSIPLTHVFHALHTPSPHALHSTYTWRSYHWPTRSEQIRSDLVGSGRIWSDFFWTPNGSDRANFLNQIPTRSGHSARICSDLTRQIWADPSRSEQTILIYLC